MEIVQKDIVLLASLNHRFALVSLIKLRKEIEEVVEFFTDYVIGPRGQGVVVRRLLLLRLPQHLLVLELFLAHICKIKHLKTLQLPLPPLKRDRSLIFF